MNAITFDCETVGLYGIVVLIQYAEGDGPVILHEVWTRPIQETLDLIERFANHPDGIIGFNLTFDWFHICKCYTVFRLCDPNWIPEDHIDEIAMKEKEGMDGPCVKPVKCFDVMLHARKGPYQTLMERESIRIKKIPSMLAHPLAAELEKRIDLDDIYFSRRKNKFAPQWQVFDIVDEDGDIIPDFKDVVLKFRASSGLKTLAAHALKLPPAAAYEDITPGNHPEEYGYAPFASANGGTVGNWGKAWPGVIRHHIFHWEHEKAARRYAENDVIYTRGLYNHFGQPEMSDDDSELACLVAAVRWKGFAIDIPGLRQLKAEAEKRIKETPTAPAAVKAYINPHLGESERAVLLTKTKDINSTKKMNLEVIARFTESCPRCQGGLEPVTNSNSPESNDCDCQGGQVKTEAAKRAKEVLDARFAKYEINFYGKLLVAGRLHPDFNIIGALSSRMSGSSQLNAQGIKATKEIRSKFLMAFPPNILLGGDFESFEVVIAIAVYGDEKLAAAVNEIRECYKCHGLGKTEYCHRCHGKGEIKNKATGIGSPGEDTIICSSCNGLRIKESGDTCYVCDGKRKIKTKIHALMGTLFYPHLTYEQIVESAGQEVDYYTRSKSGFFALIYGGTGYTLIDRLGVEPEAAEEGVNRVSREFPKVGESRSRIQNDFCGMKQLAGVGSQITWTDPKDYVEEPVTGHRRYFTLENMIAKALYDLANKPPKDWRNLKVKVYRRDREQTAGGATQSALYAAGFTILSANVRAAQNHQIQSAGAKITKSVQRHIWNIQPSGINPWLVQPFNVHDELLVVTDPEKKDQVFQVVDAVVDSFRVKVPMIKINFKQLENWGSKS